MGLLLTVGVVGFVCFFPLRPMTLYTARKPTANLPMFDQFFIRQKFFSLYLYYNKKPLRLAGESRRFNNCLRLSFAERKACGLRCRFLSFLE